MSMRIAGLASGLDIDGWVKQLMSAHRQPLIKLQQQKQLLEWKRDDYRTINSKLLELRNLTFDMRLSTSYTARAATSSSSAVSVSAAATATEGAYTLKVNSLATAAALTSKEAVGAKSKSGGATKLSELGLADGTTLTIGGEKGTATINVRSDMTIDELVLAFNNQSNQTGVRLSYDSSLDHFFFTSTKTGAQSKITLQSADADLLTGIFKLDNSPESDADWESVVGHTVTGDRTFAASTEKIDSDLAVNQTLRITYGDKTYDFTVSSDKSIGVLIQEINGSDLGKAGVSAYLDADGKLAFNNPDNGKSLAFSDETSDSTDVVELLGLSAPSVSTPANATSVTISGTDAEVEFNGAIGTFATNTFQINGINISVKEKTDSPVTINVTQDVDAVFDKIKTFVDKYNEIIAFVNDELKETRYRDFAPLTQEQRDEMSEDEIKRWEERARSGMLRSDQLLGSVLSNLRSALSKAVEGLPGGDLKHLSQIGITTGAWSEQGKLYIDEAKLKDAIAENPDQVMAMFTANDGIDGASAQDGFAVRFYAEVDAAIKKLTTRAGSAASSLASYDIGKQIGNLEDEMENWQRRLDNLQTRYYRQFSAMESAINQMNMQMSYLMQQFGGGGA